MVKAFVVELNLLLVLLGLTGDFLVLEKAVERQQLPPAECEKVYEAD